MIQFRADYKPTALKRPRLVRNNLVYDPSKKDKKEWLMSIQKHIPKVAPNGPLKIQLEFYFARPKNHFRTGKYSGQLKDSAPLIHMKMPDIDNLAKFILDAMNGYFYEDDRQVVELSCHKEYTNEHHNKVGYTMVTIMPYKGKNSIFNVENTTNEKFPENIYVKNKYSKIPNDMISTFVQDTSSNDTSNDNSVVSDNI